MKWKYCKIDGVKMNRLFYNQMKIVNDKKQGSKQGLDCYYCTKCNKIYRIEKRRWKEVVPLVVVQ